MKIKSIIVYVLLLSAVLSCSKKNNLNPSSTGTVTINGTVYPTVTIGNQVWTTQNYSGPGGNEIMTTTGDPILNGNYYNADNITLPAGWRIPSRQDFNTLLSNYSSVINTSGDVVCNQAVVESLISKTGWDGITGNNSTGFNAYSAGSLYIDNAVNGFTPVNQYKTVYAEYLTTSAYDDGTTIGLQINNNANSLNDGSYTNMAEFTTMSNFTVYYVSVRFVKNKQLINS